jgi:hypothetical protein
MPLYKVEELMEGHPRMLIHLAALIFRSKKMPYNKIMSKGIYLRNNLTIQDFKDYPFNTEKMVRVAEQIEQVVYEEEYDMPSPDDEFRAVSTPRKNYLRIPKDVKVTFVTKPD